MKVIRKGHDDLLTRLLQPDERQNFQTDRRRTEDAKQSAIEDANDDAYEKWCHDKQVKTWEQEYIEHEERLIVLGTHERIPDREHAKSWIDAIDYERDNPDKRVLHEFPMDDDEYHDLLTNVLATCFGDAVQPPSDPEERDSFDFAKMGLERRIARVARDPDTLKKISEKFYDFAALREPTERKYSRTIGRLIEEVGNLPIGQVTPKMLREYRDKLKVRGPLPSSIRAEFTPLMGVFAYAVDEELAARLHQHV